MTDVRHSHWYYTNIFSTWQVVSLKVVFQCITARLYLLYSWDTQERKQSREAQSRLSIESHMFAQRAQFSLFANDCTFMFFTHCNAPFSCPPWSPLHRFCHTTSQTSRPYTHPSTPGSSCSLRFHPPLSTDWRWIWNHRKNVSSLQFKWLGHCLTYCKRFQHHFTREAQNSSDSCFVKMKAVSFASLSNCYQ